MSKRPGGLTALAVLNFVFGGLGLLGLLALFALLSAADEATGGAVTDAPGAGLVYFLIILSLISVCLMIASGVGYLKQAKFLGRTLGNSYAAVSIGNTVIGLVMADAGFGIGTIIGLIYPVLTLILLNTTFKDDFIN